jgi:hypothetical protein
MGNFMEKWKWREDELERRGGAETRRKWEEEKKRIMNID